MRVMQPMLLSGVAPLPSVVVVTHGWLQQSVSLTPRFEPQHAPGISISFDHNISWVRRGVLRLTATTLT
jgi:hypothetical protein